ncbi:hypothetical protein DV495_004261 [Geotrichum candidum]|nr:hypothetical protein DV453_003141 [Geotrichum candidum]KAI9211713.1 hypothetical protein DS838_003389 [Geotrichum bryndzae]KAF5112112.1 hypothetical protein DV452_004176 [Geotrichum candidum]KAF5116091.1 hypothetical protein DV454_001881 [Geotrichum candidum]KAF5121669.1 hypothetical protein DV495_004261 [Geotrichum candidum]
MSKYTPDLQAWFDNTQDPGVQPAESDYLPQEKVKDIIKNNPKEIALIDLRKGDFIGIHNSIDDLYDLYKASGKKEIVIYCLMFLGSSRDRASRVWGWFENKAKQEGENGPKPYILKGGFSGWVAQGPEYTELVDDYVPQQ